MRTEQPGSGYRYLEIGEIVSKGDEYFEFACATWIPAIYTVGYKIDKKGWTSFYRRKIEQKKKKKKVG